MPKLGDSSRALLEMALAVVDICFVRGAVHLRPDSRCSSYPIHNVMTAHSPGSPLRKKPQTVLHDLQRCFLFLDSASVATPEGMAGRYGAYAGVWEKGTGVASRPISF